MSFIIHSVSAEDYPGLKALALKYPLLNLPAESRLLKQKIQQSEKSFAGILKEKNFVFVLKARKTGRIIGSAQVASQSGTREKPSYSLKIFKGPVPHKDFLRLKVIHRGPSYLGGLILDEKYRGHPEKAGKQISLIRFLFCFLRPGFFKSRLHAEVAPFLDPKGNNPFFEYFIKKKMSFTMPEIDYLTLTDKEKLFASYPRGKILLSSLPPAVQKTFGPARRLEPESRGAFGKTKFLFYK